MHLRLSKPTNQNLNFGSHMKLWKPIVEGLFRNLRFSENIGYWLIFKVRSRLEKLTCYKNWNLFLGRALFNSTRSFGRKLLVERKLQHKSSIMKVAYLTQLARLRPLLGLETQCKRVNVRATENQQRLSVISDWMSAGTESQHCLNVRRDRKSAKRLRKLS